MIYNGVFGVSENIVVQPSSTEAGQVISKNAATGTPIAVINYVLNTDIIVNGSSPAGSAGDTDTLTLRGTDGVTTGTNGNDTVVADFSNAGTAADPLVRMSDQIAGVLYNLQNFSNFNVINFELLLGNDQATMTGRSDGSLRVNIDGGVGEAFVNDVSFPGVADQSDDFTYMPGAVNNKATVFFRQGGANVSTEFNLTNVHFVDFAAGGGDAIDDITVRGTTGPNAFNIQPTTSTSGLISVDAYPIIFYGGLGHTALGSSVLTIQGGEDDIDGDVNSVVISGSVLEDTYTYNAIASNQADLRLTDALIPVDTMLFFFDEITSLSIDAMDPTAAISPIRWWCRRIMR